MARKKSTPPPAPKSDLYDEKITRIAKKYGLSRKTVLEIEAILNEAPPVPPTVSAVSPSELTLAEHGANPDAEVTITVTGTGFVAGSKLMYGNADGGYAEQPANVKFTVVSATEATFVTTWRNNIAEADDAAPGPWSAQQFVGVKSSGGTVPLEDAVPLTFTKG